MAKTVPEGFDQFLRWVTPSSSERTANATHRQGIYTKLNEVYGLHRMFETGSFKHGTGVSGYSDVDYFVSLRSNRPASSNSILVGVKQALQEKYPLTTVRISRPAVVVDFANGAQSVEIIPAYAKEKLANEDMKFNIPGVVDEWLESTPETHLSYVNQCNNKTGVQGGAKSLARLAKAWKYYRDIPISSFYLEMRAAAYMGNENAIIYSIDLKRFLKSLQSHQLSSMNDPTGATGRIIPCSSTAKHAEAMRKLDTAVNRAEWAHSYETEGKLEEAFEKWNLLFNSKFPAYY